MHFGEVALGVYHVFFQAETEGLWEEDHRGDMHFLSHQECMLSVHATIITDKVDTGHLTEIAFASHYKVFLFFVFFFAVVVSLPFGSKLLSTAHI